MEENPVHLFLDLMIIYIFTSTFELRAMPWSVGHRSAKQGTLGLLQSVAGFVALGPMPKPILWKGSGYGIFVYVVLFQIIRFKLYIKVDILITFSMIKASGMIFFKA